MRMQRLRLWVSGTVLGGVLLSLALAYPSSAASWSQSSSRAAEADCAIDVKSYNITDWSWLTAGARHLFIVHTDASGVQTGFRGGPSKEGGSSSSSSSSSSGKNVIVVIKGPWNNTFVDWGGPGETSKRVMSGPGACSKKSCFEGEVTRINDTKTPYKGTWPQQQHGGQHHASQMRRAS